MAFIIISFRKLVNTAPPEPSKLSGLFKLPVQGQLEPEHQCVLGTSEHRWHTTSNRKHPLSKTTRGLFNKERVNVRGPVVQEIVIYNFDYWCTSLSCPLGSLPPRGEDTRRQLAPRGAKFPGVSSPPPWVSCPPLFSK